MASTAGTYHRRTMESRNTLSWKECPMIMESNTNGIHCRLLLWCCSERWEASSWRHPLLAANSSSTRIQLGVSARLRCRSSGQSLGESKKVFCGAAVGVNSDLWICDPKDARAQEKPSVRAKKWRESIPKPVTCWDGCTTRVDPAVLTQQWTKQGNGWFWRLHCSSLWYKRVFLSTSIHYRAKDHFQTVNSQHCPKEVPIIICQ